MLAWLGPAPVEAVVPFAVPCVDPGVVVAKLPASGAMGVRISASSESRRCCGVCTVML